MAVGQLADEYFERMINGRWERPNIVRSRIEKDIKPHLGRLALDAVEPRPIDLADAGGKELARERPLSRDELVALFEAMRQSKGFSVQNELTVKLLLLLAVRKGELIAARWDEFELEADPPVWHLLGAPHPDDSARLRVDPGCGDG